MKLEFRVWDKRRKEYSSSSGFLDSEGNYYDERIETGEPQNKDFVVEQYTGLKDINGNKIFEGDIVSYNLVREYGANYDPVTLGFMGNDLDIDTVLIGKVVVWPSQGVMVTNIRVDDPEQFDEKYPIPKRCHVNQQFEVIGNVHENMELLEVEK